MSGVSGPLSGARSSSEEEELPASPHGNDSPFEVPSLPDGAGLKPHLDSIFADVQANLPSIDFDLSDASSDDDLQILTRSIPRRKSSNKNKQRSPRQLLGHDSWERALNAPGPGITDEVGYEFKDLPPRGDKSMDSKDSGMSSSGSYERNRHRGLERSHETTEQDASLEEVDKGSDRLTSSTCSASSQSDDDTLEVIEEIVGFKHTPLRLNFDEHIVRSPHMIIDENANLSSDDHPRKGKTPVVVEGRRSLEGNVDSGGTGFESFIPSGVPQLEMGPIDHIDLDLLLDAFPERQTTGPRNGEEQQTVPKNGAGDVDRSEGYDSLKLMSQLAQLCVDQSGGSVKSEDLERPSEPAPKQTRQVSGRQPVRSTWNAGPKNSEETPRSAVDLASGPPPTDKEDVLPPRSDSTLADTKSEEAGGRGTIYLDLRTKVEKPDGKIGNPEAIRRILHLQSGRDPISSSDDDSDAEDPRAAWHAHRRRALERARQVKGQLSDKPPAASNQLEDKRCPTRQPRRVIPLAEDTSSSVKAPSSTVAQKTTIADPPTPPHSPASATPDRESTGASRKLEQRHRSEVAKRLRGEREAERKARLRLRGQLAAMKPSMSGKSPAPQGIPIIFDIDSSYSVPPEPLPPSLRAEGGEVVLLTARLSRTGEISTFRVSDNPQTAAATYHTLLSFLLSLVPTSLDFVRDKSAELKSAGGYLDGIPFRVVGLQQASHGEQLTLHVAVVPKIAETSPFFKSRSRKQKVGGSREGLTSFQRTLTRFLASHTLQNVCPWLNDLEPLAMPSDGDLTGSLPESHPRNGQRGGQAYSSTVPQPTTKPLETFMTINQDPKAARRMFSVPISFFWATVSCPGETFPDFPSALGDTFVEVQTTTSLIYEKLFRQPRAMMGILHRISWEGLGMAGLRVLYGEERILSDPGGIHPQQTLRPDVPNLESKRARPVLAVAIRGSQARRVWLDALGPSDPVLAKRTDPASIMATYGGTSREGATIHCPRNPDRMNYELAYWFGGRVPPDGVVDLRSLGRGMDWSTEGGDKAVSAGSSEGGKKRRKKGAKKNTPPAELGEREEFQLVRTHISTLVATTPGDIFLTVAPLVPPTCLGLILSLCHRRGFLLCGIRRMRLNSKRATSLGLSGAQIRIFSPVSCTTPTSPKNYEDEIRSCIESGFPPTTRAPMPSTLLLLRKENVLHHASSLQEALMDALSVNGVLQQIREETGLGMTLDLCFQVTPYSDSLLTTLGGDFNKVPTYERFASSSVPLSFYSNPELEQIVVIAFTGAESLKTAGDSLGALLGMRLESGKDNSAHYPDSSLEVLGLKLIPSLTMAQAKELTPYEVGSGRWRGSVQYLASKPALLVILRGVNAFQRVQKTLHTSLPTHNPAPTSRGFREDDLKLVMSATPEIAYRQAAHFFRDHELFADPSMRENLRYFPPLRSPSLEELSTARFSWAEDPPHSPGGGGKKSKKAGVGNRGSSKATMIVEESIFKTMLTGPRLLTTLLLIKPFAVQKYLSKVLKRILQEDFTIVAMRLLMLSPVQAAILVPGEARTNEIVSSMHVTHLMSGPCLALCLLRENAVKKLLDLLGPPNPVEAKRANQFHWRGLYGANTVTNALHGSESYRSAIEEVKALFPDGLSHTETPDLRADQIAAPGIDKTLGLAQATKRNFSLRGRNPSSGQSSLTSLSSDPSTESCGSGVPPVEQSVSSMGVSASLSEISLPSHSALCQTNCLLLTPLLQLLDVGVHRKGYVEVIDALLSHGFEIVGARMFWLTRTQAEEFLMIYHRSTQQLSEILRHGPCIALAVQRDNAVNCFESSLGSSLERDSIMSKYGSQILRPKDTAGAREYLTFFFDELMPHSQGYIAEDSE